MFSGFNIFNFEANDAVGTMYRGGGVRVGVGRERW